MFAVICRRRRRWRRVHHQHVVQSARFAFCIARLEIRFARFARDLQIQFLLRVFNWRILHRLCACVCLRFVRFVWCLCVYFHINIYTFVHYKN